MSFSLSLSTLGLFYFILKFFILFLKNKRKKIIIFYETRLISIEPADYLVIALFVKAINQISLLYFACEKYLVKNIANFHLISKNILIFNSNEEKKLVFMKFPCLKRQFVSLFFIS